MSTDIPINVTINFTDLQSDHEMRRIVVHGPPNQKQIDHLLLLYAQFDDRVFNNNFDADQDLMLLTASLQVEIEPKWPRAFYDSVFRSRWDPPGLFKFVMKSMDWLMPKRSY